MDLEDLSVDGGAHGRELEVSFGALEARPGHVPGQLEGPPVRLREHAIATKLPIALQLPLGVCPLGSQSHHLGLQYPRPQQHRENLTLLDPISLFDTQLADHHSWPRRPRDADDAAIGLETPERGDSSVSLRVGDCGTRGAEGGGCIKQAELAGMLDCPDGTQSDGQASGRS